MMGETDLTFSGYPVAEIKWIDSAEHVPNEEIELDELPRPQIKMSCGYLVGEGSDHIVVAGIVNTHGTGDYVIAIPRVAIQEIKLWQESKT